MKLAKIKWNIGHEKKKIGFFSSCMPWQCNCEIPFIEVYKIGVHVFPSAVISVDKDRFLCISDSFLLKVFPYTLTEIFNTLLRDSASEVYVMNVYETHSGSFMTVLIFVEIRASGWMPFWENLVPWNSHQSVYANAFRNVFRVFIKWSTVRLVLLFQRTHKLRGNSYTLIIVLQSSCHGNKLYI